MNVLAIGYLVFGLLVFTGIVVAYQGSFRL